jgi:hypothetical protein
MVGTNAIHKHIKKEHVDLKVDAIDTELYGVLDGSTQRVAVAKRFSG